MEFYDVTEDVVADYLAHEGEASNIPDSEFDPVKLAVGVLVEVEHSDDFNVAKEIAKDHLVEDSEYYGKYIFPEQAIDTIEDEVQFDPYVDFSASEMYPEDDYPASCDEDAPLGDLPYEGVMEGCFGFVDCGSWDCPDEPVSVAESPYGDVLAEDFGIMIDGQPVDLDAFEASDIVVITLGENWRQRVGQSLVSSVVDNGDHYLVGGGGLFSRVFFEVLDSHVRILPRSEDSLHLFDSYRSGSTCLVPVSDFRRILAGGSDSLGALASRVASLARRHKEGTVVASTFSGDRFTFPISQGSTPESITSALSDLLSGSGYCLSDVSSLAFRSSELRFKPLASSERKRHIDSARGAYIDPWRDLCLEFLQEVPSLRKVPKAANGIKKQIFGDDHLAYWYVEKLDGTFVCVEFHVDPTDGYSEVFVRDDYDDTVFLSFVIEDLEDFSLSEVDRVDEAIMDAVVQVPESEAV